MTKKIEKKFLLGLFLFTRQLQLSIDRSFGDWEGLVDYLSSKTSIDLVLDKLKSIGVLNLDHIKKDEIEEVVFSKGTISSFMNRKYYLSTDEIGYIYSKLKTMSLYLLKKESPDREILIRLRMDFQHSEELIRTRVSRSELKGMEFVEHFNQNNSLNCKGIEELIDSPWP